MSETTSTDPMAGDGLPLRLAFYLPQFHSTPENDAWHGRGFTEWTAVVRSRPLFPGHLQPHLPGELGFCDIRLPETRELQARLARAHGISGFCYYHYWFKGRRMLERPFREVLNSGKPDFPFCLCWANENWYRRWMGAADELLMEQEYDEADDIEHIRYLIEAFRDDRYIRIKGRPLLSVYKARALPNPKRTLDIWRQECARAGVPEPWLVAFESWGDDADPAEIGFDAKAEFVPHGIDGLVRPISPPSPCHPGNTVFAYGDVVDAYIAKPDPSWIRYPCVATGWDNTPRRRDGEAFVLSGSTPELYGKWLTESLRHQQQTQGKDGAVFINAWNEWAEGAHLEPDVHFGRRYLEVTRDVVQSLGGNVHVAGHGPNEGVPVASLEDRYAELYQTVVQLQARLSGYLSWADRRLQSLRTEDAAEQAELRLDNRRLAERCLSLEAQLARATAQR